MFNEYDYLGRLEMADADDLSQMLLNPSEDEERTLRKYLGNRRYQRMHSLAIRCEMNRTARDSHHLGNVVFIPGMLGSQLTSEDMNGVREHIWLNPRHIIAGHLARLQLDESGRAEADPNYKISATGVLKRYYGEIILALAEQWNVHAFAYDWRKDFKIAAAELHAALKQFPDDEPVHIVAHSSGGLVARWFIKQFSSRWNRRQGKKRTTSGAADAAVDQARLLMLGTPNHGLFPAALALVGQLALIHWTDMLDAQHDHASFRAIVNSFPSVYQLLPAPNMVKDTLRDKLYEVDTYGTEAALSPLHLAQAKKDHATLARTKPDPARTLYIAGGNQPTYVDIAQPSALKTLAAEYDPFEFFTKEHKLTPTSQQAHDYTSTIHKVFTIGSTGDGSVSHALGILEGVPTIYAEDSHAGLVSNSGVLLALHALLTTPDPLTQAVATAIGHSHGLSSAVPKTVATHLLPEEAQHMFEESWRKDRQRLEGVVRRVHFRSNRPLDQRNFSEEEQALRDTLAHGFLYGRNRADNALPFVIRIEKPTITIHVHCGDLLSLDLESLTGNAPIDALALGHYVGSRPHGLLHRLDMAISSYQQNGAGDSAMMADLREDQLLLDQYTQRGIIRGELAQPFFLRDPRPIAEGEPERTIAIAGMGTPGRFNEPELMILARELCWSLGRMGKKHLATVLIGTGRDNLPVAAAVSGWIRGIKHALTGAQYPLEEITFVIQDPKKVMAFDTALRQERDLLAKKNRMEILYDEAACDHTYLKQLAMTNLTFAATEEGWEREPTEASTRIAVSLTGSKYHFGAITSTASIPEREIHLDPQLVNEANAELTTEGDPKRQVELGQFMEKLLIPEDLRGPLYSSAPLVMMVDATTARIHWELLAHSEPLRRTTATVPAIDAESDDLAYQYWGTSRGFTRQLRTSFAPPPEPPPPVERILRVLVVADPAADAPLIGAEEEGIYVADLFERFNTLYHNTQNRIEVVRLFGPREAKRTVVLRHLMQRTYDVLHFCGHSFYNEDDPSGSGWLFSGGHLLSAHEFTRIDRIPKFVFSNSCESGVTPNRAGQHAQALAPSLAEAFFARGVSNFVCTAWPVDDRAARDFALTLYAGLLGIQAGPSGDLGDPDSYQVTPPLPMYEAMRAARLAVALPANDIRTWGAYQHYGNPYFRLFQPMTVRADAPSPSVAGDSGRPTYALRSLPQHAGPVDSNGSAPPTAEEPSPLIFFNGIDGSTGQVHPPVPLHSFAPLIVGEKAEPAAVKRLIKAVRAKRLLASELRKSIDKIETVGWGILYHEAEDPAVLAALRPLLDHRAKQIGNPSLIHELIYRDESSVEAWLDHHGVTLGTVEPTKVPFYLLMIGGPERIPFAFGQQLDLQYAVGRLHFTTAAEYNQYARSVIEYEMGKVKTAKEVVVFATADENDGTIRAGNEKLVKPLLNGTGDGDVGLVNSDFHLRTLTGAAATKAALQELFTPPDAATLPPALLFSVTHGVEWSMDDPRQATAQGALYCGQSGHASAPTPDEYFAAADLADDAQVQGMVAFFFACFGGGTPTHDRYFDKKRLFQANGGERQQLAAAPFFAPLPKRLLAHPNGSALACIGHIDRVFATSFSNRNGEPRLGAFRQGIGEILSGNPLGLVLTTFNERYAAKSVEISSRLEAGEAMISPKIITDWLIRNDAEGYILLGDPAVRLQPAQWQ